jgi:hypothetical protein
MLMVAAGSALLFYLAHDHWGHLFGILPYGLFLLCPVMHLFMHRGHHHRNERDGAMIQHETSKT